MSVRARHIMAKKKQKKPSQASTPLQNKLADAFRDLEQPLGDAYGAAIILEDFVERIFADGEDYLMFKRFHLNDDQLKGTFFAVYLVTGMIRDLKAKYHAVYE